MDARDSHPDEAVAWRTISSATRCASAVPIPYFPEAKEVDERIPGDAKLAANTEGGKLAPVDHSADSRLGDSQRRTHFPQGKQRWNVA